MAEFLPGTEVRARGLRWEVAFCEQLGAQTLVRLRGIEGAMRGREFDILHPFESVDPVIHDFQPEKAGPLRNWLLYHQAFLLEQALGGDALLAVQPGRLRLEPYQLVPVLRAIRMSRTRLLLADGVGLGKTIQAGLVITELMARRLAHRLLIVSPAGPLLEQWKTEMSERFGLRLDVVDRARLEEIRKSAELGANPFDHVPLGLVSIDFLKQERILEQLERTSYDVIVIDEAHHCMDVGAGADREDSQRRRLAQVLARRSDALLLLTATPHDGNDRSFASLCELLDPSLVDGRGVLRAERYRQHVVRRLKHHIKDQNTGQDLFRKREVYPIAVVAQGSRHPQFIELERSLIDLIAPQLKRAFRARQYSDVLSFIALLKRSVSTVAACLSTLQVVAERFQRLLTEGAESQESRRQRLGTLRDYQRRLERFGTLSAGEEEERQLLEAEDLAHRLAELQRDVRSGSQKLKKTADVVAALDDLIALAEAATEQDPKIEQLGTEISDIRHQEPSANILVYTEYTTSQRAAAKALQEAGFQVFTLSGEDDEQTREKVTHEFRSRDNLILVSTDASAEGLNLHDRCHQLIHLELPFNPNRLEQRNGRIDRYGQRQNPIVRYLYLRDTFEDRILLRLIAKYERQRARLTFVPNTLGAHVTTEAVSERLLKGLLDEDTRLFQSQGKLFDLEKSEPEEGADPATRELLEEIDRSLKGFQQACRSNSWLVETGSNAEAGLVAEATAANERGKEVGAVDLTQFVIDAVRFDGGQLVGKPADHTFELVIPPGWIHGLDECAGYDSSTRRIRLTTRLDVFRDAQDRPVGFLGRAHPLVRRALEKVRYLVYGEGSPWSDPRVSAVAGDVSRPALLFTFLGRITSGTGREFERVLSVEVHSDNGAVFLDRPSRWLEYARLDKAVSTGEVWERYFSTWGDESKTRAQATAREAFAPIAAGFLSERREALGKEQAELDAWLRQRANEITSGEMPVPPQLGLFEENARQEAERQTWNDLTDPAQKLAAFAADSSRSVAKRSEADGVLRLYRQRLEEHTSRLALSEPEIIPLGLLMILPEGSR